MQSIFLASAYAVQLLSSQRHFAKLHKKLFSRFSKKTKNLLRKKFLVLFNFLALSGHGCVVLSQVVGIFLVGRLGEHGLLPQIRGQEGVGLADSSIGGLGCKVKKADYKFSQKWRKACESFSKWLKNRNKESKCMKIKFSECNRISQLQEVWLVFFKCRSHGLNSWSRPHNGCKNVRNMQSLPESTMPVKARTSRLFIYDTEAYEIYHD